MLLASPAFTALTHFGPFSYDRMMRTAKASARWRFLLVGSIALNSLYPEISLALLNELFFVAILTLVPLAIWAAWDLEQRRCRWLLLRRTKKTAANFRTQRTYVLMSKSRSVLKRLVSCDRMTLPR